MTEPMTEPMFDALYETLYGNPLVEAYHDRHGTQSLVILTVTDDERASLIADHLCDRIAGKTVVEIGGGIGLLGCHLALHAKHVFCFELDPTWMSTFVHVLYATKPRNLTYIFGDAREMAFFRADVAIFCTHSGHNEMAEIGSLFAPEVIDVYAEMVGKTAVVRKMPMGDINLKASD